MLRARELLRVLVFQRDYAFGFVCMLLAFSTWIECVQSLLALDPMLQHEIIS